MSCTQPYNQFSLIVLSRPGHSAQAQGSFHRDTREAGRSSTLTLMRSGLLTRKDMDPPLWDTRSRKGGTPAGTEARHPLLPRGPSPSRGPAAAARDGAREAVTLVSTTRCPHKTPTPPNSRRARKSQEGPRRAVTPARTARSPPKQRHPRTPSGPLTRAGPALSPQSPAPPRAPHGPLRLRPPLTGGRRCA